MRGLLLLLFLVGPALGAEDPHAQHQMPAKPAADPHAGHTMPAKPAADPHAGHNTPAMEDEPADEPPPPRDFAADRIFGAEAMSAARMQLRDEHGASVLSSAMIDELEYLGGREDGYRWNAEAWMGGDINRLVLKTEGEGARELHDAEVQALYSRAIGPYFDMQAGLRHDFEPGPSRTYAMIGFEGLAPYWFEVEAAAFLSDKGDVLARLGATYDQLITQRLVIQPKFEANLAAQDMPARGIGRGISDIELGLRLRYEIRREFGPYVGVSYTRKIGSTADYARSAGEHAGEAAVVIGIRTWF